MVRPSVLFSLRPVRTEGVAARVIEGVAVEQDKSSVRFRPPLSGRARGRVAGTGPSTDAGCRGKP
jgi:hypothetical protein